MKANLKIKSVNKGSRTYDTLSSFWKENMENEDKNFGWHLGFIQTLANIYGKQPSAMEL